MNKRLKKKLSQKRAIKLNSTLNTRHLGNLKTKNGKYTKPYSFIRSDVPSNLSEESKNKLKKLNVGTVIDLRREDEIKKEPSSLADCDGINYFHISIMKKESDFPPHLITDTKGDMGDFYVLILSNKDYPYKKVFETILNSDKGVLFNCAVGKDRTGMLAAMLLMLAGVPEEEIMKDYSLSRKNLTPLYKKLKRKTLAEGKTEAFHEKMFDSNPKSIKKAMDYINETYGSMEGFLEAMGFSANDISRLKEKMF